MAAKILCKTDKPHPFPGTLTPYFSIQGAAVRDMFSGIHLHQMDGYLHLVCRDGTRMISKLDRDTIRAKRDITMQCTRLVRRYDAAIKTWTVAKPDTSLQAIKLRLDYYPE